MESYEEWRENFRKWCASEEIKEGVVKFIEEIKKERWGKPITVIENEVTL